MYNPEEVSRVTATREMIKKTWKKKNYCYFGLFENVLNSMFSTIERIFQCLMSVVDEIWAKKFQQPTSRNWIKKKTKKILFFTVFSFKYNAFIRDPPTPSAIKTSVLYSNRINSFYIGVTKHTRLVSLFRLISSFYMIVKCFTTQLNSKVFFMK